MGARILIVDDNPMNLKLARLAVMTEGHQADTASGASEAFDRLAEHLPDLILMDLQMPEVDGIELTLRLKAEARTTHIPVVALTAAAMESDRERALDAGCEGVILKPLDTRGLAEELSGYLGRPEAA